MAFELNDLPYSHDALEVVGGFDARFTHAASSGHAKGDLALLGLCRE